MNTKTHWKRLTNPDYLGAYALNPGEDLILTIKNAGKEAFVGTSGKRGGGYPRPLYRERKADDL